MNKGNTLDSIPTDLILEIFSRLSAKSVGRLRCLSKLWRSMLGLPYFTELFLTRSSDHPRLFFGVERKGEWFFFSSLQPQNLYEKPLVVAADFHMKFSEDMSHDMYSYASGLIYFPKMLIENEKSGAVRVICNPITVNDDMDILTLGTGELRSEKLKFFDAKCFFALDDIQLINYKGKLGGISWNNHEVAPVELSMWVLEDVEKQEWSKNVYILPKNVVPNNWLHAAGVTVEGDIVFSEAVVSNPFDVFYFNPEKNTLQHVETHCNHEVFDDENLVNIFVDHVEDLKFDVMKPTYAATSIRPTEQKHKPTSTETSMSRKDHQVRTIDQPQQDRCTFEIINNKFDVMCLLDYD
ncbi:F-box associated domain type 3 [Arabidopsis thaliana x Arabidopsis arenosa]|uniref:F-box associated domain type 3 n=1 Tax=Arabidopsis thaliana x Arabidopsis arenosa TaxID=1240361 RepID=A0A8T2GM57_9BRAS|nr:F-box associated domain type 3 [Arabidopsis thaliana x Arabidopsis arenosa]